MSNFKQYLREAIQYSLNEEWVRQSNAKTKKLGWYNTETGVMVYDQAPEGPLTRTKGQEGTHYWGPNGGWIKRIDNYPGLGPGDEGYYDHSLPGGGIDYGGGWQA